MKVQMVYAGQWDSGPSEGMECEGQARGATFAYAPYLGVFHYGDIDNHWKAGGYDFTPDDC
jgi:hypothetical protein